MIRGEATANRGTWVGLIMFLGNSKGKSWLLTLGTRGLLKEKAP